MLDRPNTPTVDADYATVSRMAVAHWALVAPYIFGWKGRPTTEVIRLAAPAFQGWPNGAPSAYPFPVCTELRGPSPFDDGSWHCASAYGENVIDLVAHLGRCDKATAFAWLRDLVGRIADVEIPA